MKKFGFYFNFDWEKYIEDSENYLNQLLLFSQFIECYEASMFYSKTQLDDFVKNISDMDDNFIISESNKIDVIIKNAKGLQDECEIYALDYSHRNSNLRCIENKIVAVFNITDFCIVVTTECVDIHTYSDTLYVIPNSSKIIPVSFCQCSTIDEIESKLKTLITPRNFNLIDKHGENGKNSWSHNKGSFVSTLLCSRIEAQLLLDNAIPDYNEFKNRLFNYDEQKDQYIEFYYEGDNPQKQWHGFHLSKQDAVNRIPKRVKRYLTLLRNLD